MRWEMLREGTGSKSTGLPEEDKLGTPVVLSSPSSKKMQMARPAAAHHWQPWGSTAGGSWALCWSPASLRAALARARRDTREGQCKVV